MVEPILKPLKQLYDKKQEIESKIKQIESKGKSNSFYQVLMGVNHSTLSQAIVADIIDTLPVVGEVTNVSRIKQSEEPSRRFLQGFDLALEAIPPPFGKIADILFPSNTLWYIDQKLKKG